MNHKCINALYEAQWYIQIADLIVLGKILYFQISDLSTQIGKIC